MTDKPELMRVDACEGGGRVSWWFYAHLAVSCNMNFNHYPMDSHDCKIYLSSMDSNSSKEIFTIDFDKSRRYSLMYDQKMLAFETDLMEMPERQ